MNDIWGMKNVAYSLYLGGWTITLPFIYTAGYATKDLLENILSVSLPVRYWKSHLAVTPRLSRYGIFTLDVGEAAMMNHEDVSIVGLNEDAVEWSRPDMVPEPERMEAVLAGAQRLFRNAGSVSYVPLACVKVDLPEDTRMRRSLNIKMAEPLPNHIAAFPGKMTETPYLTDVLTRMVYERLSQNNDISPRPCDIHRGSVLSKQGAETGNGIVLKEHPSLQAANTERRIAELYAANRVKPVRVPDYFDPVVKEGKIYASMRHVTGTSPLKTKDSGLLRELVEDLAVFHELFSRDKTLMGAVALYRDAIITNYLLDDRGHVHIDFSSSSRFVHALDDLALLLNPLWIDIHPEDRDSLASHYFDTRRKLKDMPRGPPLNRYCTIVRMKKSEPGIAPTFCKWLNRG